MQWTIDCALNNSITCNWSINEKLLKTKTTTTQSKTFRVKIMYEIWHKTPILNGAPGTSVKKRKQRNKKIPVCGNSEKREKLLNFSFLMYWRSSFANCARFPSFRTSFRYLLATYAVDPGFFFLPPRKHQQLYLYSNIHRAQKTWKRKIVLIHSLETSSRYFLPTLDRLTYIITCESSENRFCCFAFKLAFRMVFLWRILELKTFVLQRETFIDELNYLYLMFCFREKAE